MLRGQWAQSRWLDVPPLPLAACRKSRGIDGTPSGALGRRGVMSWSEVHGCRREAEGVALGTASREPVTPRFGSHVAERSRRCTVDATRVRARGCGTLRARRTRCARTRVVRSRSGCRHRPGTGGDRFARSHVSRPPCRRSRRRGKEPWTGPGRGPGRTSKCDSGLEPSGQVGQGGEPGGLPDSPRSFAGLHHRPVQECTNQRTIAAGARTKCLDAPAVVLSPRDLALNPYLNIHRRLFRYTCAAGR